MAAAPRRARAPQPRSGELTGLADQVVGDVDLARPLLGELAHALGQALGRELVRVVFAHQLAVCALDLRLARLRRDAERRVRVVQALLRRGAAGGRSTLPRGALRG